MNIVWFIFKVILAVGIVGGVLFFVLWIYSFFWVASLEKKIFGVKNISKNKKQKENKNFSEDDTLEILNKKVWEDFLVYVAEGSTLELHILKQNTELLEFDSNAIVEINDDLNVTLENNIRKCFREYFKEEIELKLIILPR